MLSLSVRGLSVAYPGNGGVVLPALGPLTFRIEAGAFVTLVGPSGCGKSTLIRVLAGLQKPSRGDALLDATPIVEPSPRVGLMFQEANLMPWRTVRDNIALPLELEGASKEDRYRVVDELLPALGLVDFASAYPAQLSGGMAQRAALGRVLIQKPDVLLLDEPFGALDAMTREQISTDLVALWRRYRPTVLMVTHDINEALLLSDRVLVMSSRPGQVVADVAVTLEHPRQPADIYNEGFGAAARQIRRAIGL